MAMNYLINSRNYTSVLPLSEELNFLPRQNYLFDLDYLTVLSVEGERAAEFLQGQLSCDVREVTGEQMRQGVMCNLKGRILAILDVIFQDKHNLHLVLPKDLCEATQTSLAKTALLSRVQLKPYPSIKVLGLLAEDIENFSYSMTLPKNRYDVSHNEGVTCYNIDTNFYLMLVQVDAFEKMIEPFLTDKRYRGSLAWHALQLQHHRVEIYPESRGLFLPHRLDLHQYGYLSFEKGCYKGQEIIARTHYRATLKHKLVSFTIQTDTQPQPGLPLYSEDGSVVVGELIDYCPIGDGQYRIAASVLLNYEVPYRD
jgi:folate-binding protein YgfZ